MPGFSSNATMLLSDIEFLGKGVEMKSYRAERQSISVDSLVVQVSTVNTSLVPRPNMQVTLMTEKQSLCC